MTDREAHNGPDMAADRTATEDVSGTPPRLADVAASAGVSTATVSRALNQSSAVTPELRKRVHAAVDALVGGPPDLRSGEGDHDATYLLPFSGRVNA